MGYSCTAAANLTQEAMFKELEADGVMTSGNSWTHKGKEYFLEQGREQYDGAITGTIWVTIQSGIYKGRVKRSGSVRIESNGIITRWPCVPSEYRKRAEAIGAAMFIDRFGPRQAEFENLLRR